MSTIQSSSEHLTLNADGAAKEIKLQANGVEKAKVTSTGFDVTGVAKATTGFKFGSGESYMYESATDKISFRIGSDGPYPFFQDGGGSLALFGNASGSLAIATGSTERMRIESGGRIEMGSLSTTGASVGWKLNLDATDPEVQTSATTIGTGVHQRFYNPNGNVGTIYTTGSSTVYSTSSDYRLKENVVPMSASIDRLKQLKPVRFNFTADADTTVDGFLAHEVSDIVPEAISGEKDAMRTEEYEVTPAVEATYDDDGNELTPAVEAVMGEREVPDYQGIDQAKLVPLLTSALQEAVAKIEALEARVEALENA